VKTTAGDKPAPYGWHWMLVHENSGQICNEGFTPNRPGCTPPPAKMKAPRPLRGFSQIGVAVYSEHHTEGVSKLLAEAVLRAEKRREGAIDLEVAKRALAMLRWWQAG
jgi:hypothetical protein